MRQLILCLLLTAAAQAQPGQHGQFHGCSYTAVRVDPRSRQIDLVTSGRTARGWGSRYLPLEKIPADCSVALNGTFFSLKYCQPAGPLIYDQGRKRWTPNFKRAYNGQDKPVSGLNRAFLAVFKDGRVKIGHSQGRSAEQLVEPGLACLLGGGGQLLEEGRVALQLAQEGFDERSGLRPEAAVPRTGVGLDGQGQLWLVTAGLEGGAGLSLTDFAQLLRKLGARQAMFLDCGSSTAMRVGPWQRSQGRALPTWLVVRWLP
ncbi:MAG: phosphodiester glycosidase family protein [Vulcanimicrobiota bacterium]